jgi:DNA-binding MarR family transcriptional regulator
VTTGPSPKAELRAGPPAADDEVAPQGVGFLLGVAHRGRRRAWEAELADLGLTAPQAALLRLIAAQPASGVRHLARSLGTDPMNVQRIAETLLAAGLCESRPDPGDARRRPFYPTDKGNHLAAAVADRADSAEQDLLGALGTERYRAMIAGLHALIDRDRRSLDAPTSSRNGARSDETP